MNMSARQNAMSWFENGLHTAECQASLHDGVRPACFSTMPGPAIL